MSAREVVAGVCAAGHHDRITLRPGEPIPGWLVRCGLNIRDAEGRIERVCNAVMYWAEATQRAQPPSADSARALQEGE